MEENDILTPFVILNLLRRYAKGCDRDSAIYLLGFLRGVTLLLEDRFPDIDYPGDCDQPAME